MHIFAQQIGILAMSANVVSYQFKSKRTILAFQLLGSTLFAVNMFLLDAIMGGILNIVGILRAIVYMQKERFGSNVKLINSGFMLIYALSYVAVFMVLKKEPSLVNLAIELLPIIGMSVMTVGFSGTNAKTIRICGFINSPCWLIYNCVNFSIGGILCEIIGLFSAIFAYFRLDKKIPS